MVRKSGNVLNMSSDFLGESRGRAQAQRISSVTCILVLHLNFFSKLVSKNEFIDVSINSSALLEVTAALIFVRLLDQQGLVSLPGSWKLGSDCFHCSQFDCSQFSHPRFAEH